jgi:hypothetical protein
MPFSLPLLVTRGLASLADARAAHAERMRLRAELDAYRTPAERAELAAILGRHTDDELEQLAQATGRPVAA